MGLMPGEYTGCILYGLLGDDFSIKSCYRNINGGCHTARQLGTPDSLKRKVAFPNVANHALASYVGSKDLESVREAVFDFTESVLKLQPLE